MLSRYEDEPQGDDIIVRSNLEPFRVAEQTEPQKIGYCNECKWFRDKQVCGRCRSKNMYAPKTEPKICDTCRYYNNDIPCGSTPSACKEADKFAEEFVDGLKKLKPKAEPQTETSTFFKKVQLTEVTQTEREGE